MSKKLLVVIGATGQQGGSVIDAILSDTSLSSTYTVRGTTRDATSNPAKKLSDRGIEVVSADIDDPTSLSGALKDAHTVFANTVTIYDGNTVDHEIRQGRAIVDAAIAAGVKNFIYSTLPHIGTISGGKYAHCGHFDGKAEVETYLRSKKDVIRSAFISPGSFMANFHSNMAPHPDGQGGYVWAAPVTPETRMPLFDTAGDTGKYVAAILGDFGNYEGKVLFCADRTYTMSETAGILSKQSGKKVYYAQVPVDVFKGFLPPLMVDYVTEMLLYFQDFEYWGRETEEGLKWSNAQAKGQITSLGSFLEKSPLNLS